MRRAPSFNAEAPRRDLIFLHERQVHAVQGHSGRKVAGPADGIDEPVGRAVGRRLAAALLPDHQEAQRIAHDASNRVLDGNIGRRDQIAPVFGGDVGGADPLPSQLERSLDRVDRHERLGTEPVSGSGHAALQISDRMGEVYRGWGFDLSLALWQDRADMAPTSGRAR